MKKLKFIGVIALIATACSSVNASVVTFKAKNADKGTKAMLVLSATQKPESLSFDDKGIATFKFNNAQGEYAELYFGKQRKTLFLDPKADLTVSFDVNTFQDAIQFVGATAPANNYLNSGKINFLTYKDCTVKESEFILRSDSTYNANIKVLNSQKGLNKEFVKLEKNRLKYSSYQALTIYPNYHAYMADKAYIPSNVYYDKLKSLFVEDSSLLKLNSYKSFLYEFVPLIALSEVPSTSKKGFNFLELTELKVRYVDEKIIDKTIKEFLTNKIIVENVSYDGVDGKDELIALFHKNVKDQELISKFNELTVKWKGLRAGNPSPSFTCQDINGKTVSLADLKGKFVYIDVWATWCGPCRGELPHLKKLEEAYGEKDIHFVSISCDKDKKAWETMVTKQELKGIQLIFGADDSFSKEYMINGIPRFILLDREGNIVNANATRPSDPATAKKFDELLSSK